MGTGARDDSLPVDAGAEEELGAITAEEELSAITTEDELGAITTEDEGGGMEAEEVEALSCS